MKFRPGIRRSLLTALLAAVVCIAAAEAAVPQTPPQGVKGGSVSLERFRGKKSIVRGGRMPLPDSLRRDSLGRDSLRTAVDSTLLRLDSLGGALLPQERLVLAQDAAVVVEYGNPVERGGASIVSQRIL